ncbi:MAG: twin-arginine translocase TatA/TatE family subunit [Clostridia bacterium]|nr:twin-arginine translocase TatA/TatE family subunit [Clostridia bacterium]
MRLGTTEIILIIVLALVLFGGGKLAGVGKALGKSIKDFKSEVKDAKDEAGQAGAEEKKDENA